MIDRKSRNSRHLRAGGLHIWMLLLSLAAGTLLYGWSLGSAYKSYVGAYSLADAVHLLKMRQAVWRADEQATLVALKALDIEGLDPRQAWSAEEGVWGKTPARLLRIAAKCGQSGAPTESTLALQFAVALAYCARTELLPITEPERKITGEEAKRRIVAIANQLAEMLSGRPTSAFWGQAKKTIVKQENGYFPFVLAWSNKDGRLSDLEIAKVLVDHVLVDVEKESRDGALATANMTACHRKADRTMESASAAQKAECDEKSGQEVAVLLQAIVKLFALAGNSTDVQDARGGVVLWKGWVQHALIVLGVYIFLLAVWRQNAYRKQRARVKAYTLPVNSQDDETTIVGYLTKTFRGLAGDRNERLQELRAVADRELDGLAYSRTWLAWGSRTLVGLGFLGTVLGIMDALSGAGLIVLSESRLQQAAAITDVASMLGLAFATTFIALGINLVMGLWIVAMATAESRLVAEAEEMVITVLK